MEISLKVQNIGPAETSEDKNNIVITHEFTPPSDQLLAKRGRLFITLKLQANGDFDLKEAASLFLDSTQENFYRLTEETPLHALEKALNRAMKIVLTIKSKDETKSLGSMEANFKLSFTTALIWNRVLYTSYLGNPAVYLVRGTGVRNLSMNPADNEIWTNSGIIDDQDVILIGTEAFAKAFPATEIINSLGNISQNIASHPDQKNIAAMLIKVTTSDKQNKPAQNKLSGAKVKNAVYNSLWKLKSKFAENDKLSDRFKFYQNKKTAPVSSIAGGIKSASPSQSSATLPMNPKRIKPTKSSKKSKKRVALGLAMVMGTAIIGYQLLIDPTNNIQNDITANISVRSENSRVMGASSSSDSNEATLSTTNGLHQAFLDVNSINNNVTMIGLGTTLKEILVLDANEHKIFAIDPDTKESKSIYQTQDIPLYIKCDSSVCYIADLNSFYVLNPETPDKVDQYLHELDNLTDINTFGNTVYLLTNNNIYSQILNTDNKKEWLNKSENLAGARAMAIDGNIYVLTDTQVGKFYGGNRVNGFDLDFGRLSNPMTLEVYNGRLYILDSSGEDKFIQVFNKNTGEFIETIQLAENGVDPKFFTLTKYDTNKLIFEQNKVLYEVQL